MTTDTSCLGLQARVFDDPETFTFRTVDGVNSPETFRDEELALLEVLWERDLGRLLVLQANYGVVGTVLAHTATTVRMTETSARAARLCRKNADRNDVDATTSLVASPREMKATFDTCCYAPTAYTPVDVGRQRLVDGLSTLRPDGRCYVAGRPADGLNRYEHCLERHCSTVETVSRTGEHRVIAGTVSTPPDPPQYLEYDTVQTSIDGVELSLVTAPGLFSPGRVDDGTRHLMEAVSLRDGQRVLDLCCGYGPIGTYAGRVADTEVVLTDVDVRATACAQRTLDSTGVSGTVVTGDCTRKVEGTFDQVLCNPPTHAGRGVLTDLFEGVESLLTSDGMLTVVHHCRLDLDDYLRRVGRITDRIGGPMHTVVNVKKYTGRRND